jgi:hypothetical protein
MSKTKALHEFCKGCIYDPACGGTWREQVEACTSQHCPLWQHRPVTVATINLQRKARAEVSTLDMDAILAGLDDEDVDVAVVADPVA